ncbi:MAG: TIGR03560 family F420-dependent LLM class oxidoreductase [Myxococcota bacterium]
MRFTFWPSPNHPFDVVLDLARHVEATGWDGMVYADHFMPDGPQNGGPWLEAWTTVTALLASVPRIRIGPLVTGNTYRHPAVLAKMAATVDRMSGGRLVLGLGAGWQENEHRAYGIPFPSLRERLERLEEACQVLKSLFTEERASFEGRYYQLADAPLEPKPLQDPLPLLVGGGGEKVTLRIAARFADEWNVWGDVPTLQHKMSVLDRHCREVGRDPAEIKRSAVALLFLSDDRGFIENIRQKIRGRPLIAGDVAEVRATIEAYAEAGVDEIIVPDFTFGGAEKARPILDTFIQKVAEGLH